MHSEKYYYTGADWELDSGLDTSTFFWIILIIIYRDKNI